MRTEIRRSMNSERAPRCRSEPASPLQPLLPNVFSRSTGTLYLRGTELFCSRLRMAALMRVSAPAPDGNRPKLCKSGASSAGDPEKGKPPSARFCRRSVLQRRRPRWWAGTERWPDPNTGWRKELEKCHSAQLTREQWSPFWRIRIS